MLAIWALSTAPELLWARWVTLTPLHSRPSSRQSWRSRRRHCPVGWIQRGACQPFGPVLVGSATSPPRRSSANSSAAQQNGAQHLCGDSRGAPRRRGARSNKTLLAVLMMSPSPRARQDNPTGPSIMWHESSQKLEPLLDEFGCWRVRFRCSIPHFSRALSYSRVCAARVDPHSLP